MGLLWHSYQVSSLQTRQRTGVGASRNTQVLRFLGSNRVGIREPGSAGPEALDWAIQRQNRHISKQNIANNILFMNDSLSCPIPFAVGIWWQGNVQSLHPSIGQKMLLVRRFEYCLYHCFLSRSLKAEVSLGQTSEESPCVCHNGGKCICFYMDILRTINALRRDRGDVSVEGTVLMLFVEPTPEA